MKHEAALRSLRDTLDALRARRIASADLCRTWRAQQELVGALPPRYGEVMEALLARLESGSLFGEESCSFSQHDLIAALADWLDKAEHKLVA